MSFGLVFNALALCSVAPAIALRNGQRPSRLCVRVAASPDDNSIAIQSQSSSSNQGNGSSLQQRQQSQQQRSPMRRQTSPLSPLDLWDPFMPTSRTFSQMIDSMNQILESGTGMPAPMLPTIQRRSSGRLPWDVMEDEESFKMRVDMPGLTKDEVKVSIVDDGFLLIKGETSQESKEGGDKWAVRSVGSYESRVMLPENADAEKISAELKDGVLYVTVPKKKVEAKKPIEIQVS